MADRDKEGGSTEELAPARPQPDRPFTTQTDVRSLSLSGFLDRGRRAIGIQDWIFGGNHHGGAHVIWRPKGRLLGFGFVNSLDDSYLESRLSFFRVATRLATYPVTYL
jgi:hypothetical protein